MTRNIANGRTRFLDLYATGLTGQGEKCWIVWTLNANGSVHWMERFTNKNEAINWFKYA